MSGGNPINTPTSQLNRAGAFNPKLIVRGGTGITDQQKRDLGVDFYGTHFTPIDKQNMMERQRIATKRREDEEEDQEIIDIIKNRRNIMPPPPPFMPPTIERVRKAKGGVPDFNLFDF
jgi:hypothetical protein